MRRSDQQQAVIGKRRRKLELYATASIAGLSVLLAAPPVRAQSVNAGFAARNNVSTPSAQLTLNTGSETRVQVNTSQAIIDWTPTVGDERFILPNTTTTFYNTNSGGFTVLNVIASGTTPMRFDGSVVSRLGSLTGTPGGKVWFYSPGGIIVGNNASFDVGSLLLTTLNPVPGTNPGDSFASFSDGTNGTIGFLTDTNVWPGDGNNASQIQIGGNAAILAQNYVALVAPRIVQTGGTIRAGGAIGLIAGEQVNLDIEASGGLFGISIPLGTGYEGNTESTAAIVQNQGGIGADAAGVASPSTANTARQIYMVAVPKNTAVTMLLAGGQVGYGADSATATNDGIVLLAGAGATTSYDGSGNPSHSFPSNPSATGTIQFGSATSLVDVFIASNLGAYASNVSAGALATNLFFSGTTELAGDLASSLTATAGHAVTAFGDVSIAGGSGGVAIAAAGNINAASLTINSTADLAITATGSGAIALSGDFTSGAAGRTSITGTGAAVPTIQAANISIEYFDYASSGALLSAIGTPIDDGRLSISGYNGLTVGPLVAKTGISLQSGGGITIGDATVLAAARADDGSGIDTSVAYFRATAGQYEGQYGSTSSDGALAVNGAIRAAGPIDLQTPGSISLGAASILQSENAVSFSAGSDILVAAGALVSAGSNPVNPTTGGIFVTAGDGTTFNDTTHSVISDGTLDANGSPLAISADAFQILTGTLRGSTVSVALRDSGATDNDGGQLITACTAGSMCLGTIAATDGFSIDTRNRTPQAIWLAGAITAPTLDVHALNGITLGFNGNHDINIAGTATLDAGTGAILASPGSGGTVSAASLQMLGTDLVAPLHTFRTTSGDLTIDVANDVQAAGFDAFARLGHTGSSGFESDLILNGSFYAGSLLSVGTGGIAIQAQGITIGQLMIATGPVALNANGAVRVADLLAGGPVSVSGNAVDLTSSGAMTLNALSAGDGGAALTSAGQLTIANAGLASAATFTSTGAGVSISQGSSNSAIAIGAAGPVTLGFLSAASLDIASTGGGIAADHLVSLGTTNLSAAGPIALPDFLAAGPIRAVGGGVRITASRESSLPQSLSFDQLGSTGGDVVVSALGDISVRSGSVIGSTTITAGAQLSIVNHTTTGTLSLASTTASSFTNLAGGTVSIVTNNALTGQGLTATGTVSLTTPGSISITGLNAAGGITANGGTLSLIGLNDMIVTSATAANGSLLLRTGGTLTVANATSSADSIFGSTNGGISAQTIASTGPVSFSAAGAVSVDSLTTGRAVSLDVGSARIASPGSLTFANAIGRNGGINLAAQGALTLGTGRATGDSSFIAGGALQVASFTTTGNLALRGTTIGAFTALAGRDVSLVATTGAISGQQLVGSGTITLTTPDTITLSAISAPGSGVIASGSRIDLTSPDALNVTRATAGDGGLRLRAAGALTVASATSTAGVDLASTGGNVTLGTIAMTGTPTGLSMQAAAGTSPLTVASAGTTTLNGDITGAGAATISGAGLVLNGLIDASGIALASQTIAVGPAALIGTLARTGTVAFTNNGTGRSFIGGSGSATGYSLDANALSRIQAASVTLSLPKTATSSVATPDVVIGGFTLYGTGAAAPSGSRQNLGTGSLAIATTGQVQVNGAVRLANLASSGSGGLAIRAAGIDVVTPSGSIVQTDAAGAPAGTLDLDARVVRVASAAALTSVATLGTPAARESRLAQTDGNSSDTGWLSANTIRFAYPSGIAAGSGIAAIYVQNSGGQGADTRRGLTTGTGGVVIADFPSSDPPEIFINGRVRTDDTNFVTGAAFLASITQTGTGATEVLVNGCVLASATCSSGATAIIAQLAPPQDLVGVISNATEDDQDEDTNKPGDPVPRKDPQAIVQLAPPNPEQDSPTSDDPVVGAGNDSLWTGGAAGGNGAAGAAAFDTVIGVGNDAGPTNDRPAAGGATSGAGAQPGERAPGAAEGGIGIGNDAPGSPRNGTGNAGGVTGSGARTPSSTGAPDRDGGGATSTGSDAAGGAQGPATPGATPSDKNQPSPKTRR